MSKMSSLLKQILSAYPHPEKLKIRDTVKVGKMIDSLVAHGPEALQVITDFDFTLTKSHLPDGTPGCSGPGVMNKSPLMTQDFREKVEALYAKYRPIEFDNHIPVEQKIPLMVEWYQKRKEVVIASKVRKCQIKEMVTTCSVALRDGVTDALALLNEKNVPVLVFSAGNGDIIEGVMQRDAALLPNTHVIANFYKYDIDGYVIDYINSTLLHVFNKNEHAIENSTYFEDISHRPNALLLGDHLADSHMADGMHNPETVFKIGFLNDCSQVAESLQLYEETFDVVLVEDQTFDFVNILLKHVFGKK